MNVNPLVSFQFAKDEFGDKTFKPLVNFHVTPNENLISKVGDLFKAKKYGYGNGYGNGAYGGGQYGGSYNQHYHTHEHYPGQTGIYHPQQQYQTGPYFENGPHFNYPQHNQFNPSGFGNDYGFGNPGGYYRDSSSSNYAEPASSYGFDPNSNSYYSRSANASNVEQTYANYGENREFANANSNNNNNQGTQAFSFPSNRRKRSVDTTTDIENNNESIAPKSLRIIEKVIKNGDHRSILAFSMQY